MIHHDCDPDSEPRRFGFPMIFFLNLFQSLFYLILFADYYLNSDNDYYFYTKDDPYSFLAAILIFGLILYGGIKCFEDKCNNCFCALVLFLIFLFYKLLLIPYFIGLFNIEVFDSSLHKTTFIYWSAGTALFYLCLIFLSCLNDRINLTIYFLTGLVSGIIFSLTEYLHKKDISNAGITFGLIMVEVIFLIGSIHYAKQNDKLKDNETTVNLLTIDQYKYIVILSLSMLVVALFLMVLACFCSGVSGGSGSSSSSNEPYKEPSHPIYEDAQGHIYDQYGKWIG